MKASLLKKFLHFFRCRHRHLDFIQQRTEDIGTPFIRLECVVCGASLLKHIKIDEANFPFYKVTRIELDEIIGF